MRTPALALLTSIPFLLCAPASMGDLLAHWPLDEDASDATGNGYDGLVVGGTVEFGQPGANANTGTAASFPDNGHIDVPFDPALNPGTQEANGSGSFTIALWANSSDNSGFNSPFTAREDNGVSVNGPIIYNNNNGNWSYWAGNNGAPGAWNALNGPAVPLNTWQHVAVTYDSATTTRKMFLDGVEVINEVIGVSANAQRDIHIGAGSDLGNNFYWNGLIDDVGFWDEALDETAILSVMNDGIGNDGVDPKMRVPRSLDVDYDGVDGDFEIVVTNSGETKDLVINGEPDIAGDNAANFSVLSFPGDPIPPGESGTIVCSFDPMGENGVFEATFEIASNDALEAIRTVPVTVTFHDPFVSAPEQIDFGVLPSGSGPQTITVPVENLGMSELVVSEVALAGGDAGNFEVGALGNLPGGGMADLELTFNANGQEGTFVAALVITSDDPLTPDLSVPITVRVEFSNPLLAHWPLDVDASDATGNGFDGTVVGGTVNFGQPGANGATGASASFPDNGHIDIAFDAALNPGEKTANGSDSFTIALWANSSDNSGFNSPFTSREDSGTVNGPIIYNNNSGNWSYWAGNNGPPGAWNPLNGPAVPLDTWQHVAVTYDSATNTRKMFIDGVEVLSAEQGVSANSIRDTHIGAGSDLGNNFYWNGLIDDVGLFRVALTEEQILKVMNNGVASFNKSSKLPFSIEATGDDMLTLRWDSQDGKLYNVRSELDPSSADPIAWPVFAGRSDLVATAPENVLVIPRPADSRRFFVIEEFNAPPVAVFSDDFESGQGDWTTGSDGAAGTAWELGTPSNVGPAAANSPVNCFGTNLAASYEFDADVWLRSPEIDLSTAGGATLRFFQEVDLEQGFDAGRIAVLDASDDSELAVLRDGIDGIEPWEQVTLILPPEALGKTIKIEFRMTSDDLENFAGWYIDDVEVTVP